MSYQEGNGNFLAGNSHYITVYFYVLWTVHAAAIRTYQNTGHAFSQSNHREEKNNFFVEKESMLGAQTHFEAQRGKNKLSYKTSRKHPWPTAILWNNL